MRSCLEVICKYNPWFSDGDTLETAVWDRAWKHVEEARMTGEDIPADCWNIWSLIKTVITIIEGGDREENLQQAVMSSCDNCELDGDGGKA